MPDIVGPDEAPDRTPRQQVLLAAEISGFGRGGPTKHRIKNLSATGARIDRAGMLKAGATVLVSVGVLEAIGATVVWVKDDLAGLEFSEAIDPEAARSKTIVHGPTAAAAAQQAAPVVPAAGPRATAGWVGDLRSPYRK